MEKEPNYIFESIGYPTIHVFDDHVKVKDRDYWEFRSFLFQDIKKLRWEEPYGGRGIITQFIIWLTKDRGPSRVKFYKTNGDSWWYHLPSFPSNEFFQFLDLVIDFIMDWKDTNEPGWRAHKDRWYRLG